MRPSELLQYLERINVDEMLPTQQGNGWGNLGNLRALLGFLNSVEELKPIGELWQGLSVARAVTDSIDATPEGSPAILAQVMATARAIYSLKKVLASISPRLGDDAIAIQLPQNTDFEVIIADQSEIRKALQIAVVPLGGEVRIIAWETGSPLWLYLAVGSVTVVEVIGRIAWAAAVIRKKLLEGDVVKEHLRSIKLGNDALEQVVEKQKVALDDLVTIETMAIYDQYFKKGEVNHEQLKNLKHSVQIFADILKRGGQVQAALLAPENVRNLFPPTLKLDSVTSKVKELTEGSGADETTPQ